MLSKNQIKLITSLQQKKYRNKESLFIVEGIKSCLEFMEHEKFTLSSFFTTDKKYLSYAKNSILITKNELKKISALKNPNVLLGVFEIPKTEENFISNGLQLVLDDIKDPGNLGTIIRMCDWFNIKQLICSQNTVDCYNPKVIQATMGSLNRINITYTNIELYLRDTNLPIYASLLEGENVYQTKLKQDAILIMGNEANGIRDNIQKLCLNKLTIPRFGDQGKTESLNVATATAILLSEFKRKF